MANCCEPEHEHEVEARPYGLNDAESAAHMGIAGNGARADLTDRPIVDTTGRDSAMSPIGYKWTTSVSCSDVCFEADSGHTLSILGMSANSQKRTLRMINAPFLLE